MTERNHSMPGRHLLRATLAGLLVWLISGTAMPALAQSDAPYVEGEQKNVVATIRKDPESFRYSGALPKRLKVTHQDLAGRAISLEDSIGKGVFDLGADGKFSFQDDAGNKGIRGYWWVDPTGRFCITSPDAWATGHCIALYGNSLASLKGGIQHHYPDRFYPMSLVR